MSPPLLLWIGSISASLPLSVCLSVCLFFVFIFLLFSVFFRLFNCEPRTPPPPLPSLVWPLSSYRNRGEGDEGIFFCYFRGEKEKPTAEEKKTTEGQEETEGKGRGGKERNSRQEDGTERRRDRGEERRGEGISQASSEETDRKSDSPPSPPLLKEALNSLREGESGLRA